MNSQGVQRNILYFSKQCPHCERFRQLLVKKPDLEASFLQLCVDGGGKLPGYVRSVPFIVVYDEKGRQLRLTDSRAFGWLRQQMEQMAGDFAAYDSSVMSSQLSDQFSFINEQSSNNGLQHNFEWIDGHRPDSGRDYIATPKDSEYGGGLGQAKIAKSELDKIVEQRNRDIPQLNRRPPHEIDFTKPLNQQLPSQPNLAQRRKLLNPEVRKRDARIRAPQRGVDFSNPNFGSAPNPRPPIKRRQPPPQHAAFKGRKLPPGWQRRR